MNGYIYWDYKFEGLWSWDFNDSRLLKLNFFEEDSWGLNMLDLLYEEMNFFSLKDFAVEGAKFSISNIFWWIVC